MTEKENIIVPRWFLEVVEDTLRIQNNINLEKETGETCQDRNVKQSLNGIRKLLNGEECFGGGWFIVMANLPTGQISNHYELKDWDLFQVPEKEFADEWDGHTPQEAAERLYKYLQQEQPDLPSGEDVMTMCNQILIDWVKEGKTQEEKEQREQAHIRFFELYDDCLMQEQPEVDLEKFTKKVDDFKVRYKHPEIVSIKGAMAFMARMFYQYPNVARQWYDSLPKATMD